MILSNKNILLYVIEVLILAMLGLIIFYDFPEKHEDFFWYDQLLYWAVNTVRIGLVALFFFVLFRAFEKWEDEEWKFRILIPIPYTKAREEWKLQREVNRLTTALAYPKQENENNQAYYMRQSAAKDAITMLKKQIRELNG